jgi:hypothetical protein
MEEKLVDIMFRQVITKTLCNDYNKNIKKFYKRLEKLNTLIKNSLFCDHHGLLETIDDIKDWIENMKYKKLQTEEWIKMEESSFKIIVNIFGISGVLVDEIIMANKKLDVHTVLQNVELIKMFYTLDYLETTFSSPSQHIQGSIPNVRSIVEISKFCKQQKVFSICDDDLWITMLKCKGVEFSLLQCECLFMVWPLGDLETVKSFEGNKFVYIGVHEFTELEDWQLCETIPILTRNLTNDSVYMYIRKN